MKTGFSEEQTIGFLGEADAGLPIKELCHWHGFSEASDYLWPSKFVGMSVSVAKRLNELETKNVRLKKLLAESLLEMEVTHEAMKKVVSDTARREMVRFMLSCGLSERRVLRVICMSASALRYQPVPDRNEALRERIVSL